MAQFAVVLLALFGQMERTYAMERAARARAVATAKGRRVGRPVLVDPGKLEWAAHLRDTGGLTRGRGRPRSARACCSISSTARLIEGKVLLPGASVLARAVTAARDRAAARRYRSLSEAADAHREPRFEELLDVPEGEQLWRWEEIRAGPRKLTANEAAESFQRLAAIRTVGVGHLTVDVSWAH